MSYLSLYRKYRSQRFEELSGQEHVTRTLQNALRQGRVAHAYLLCGPRGTGKTSTARLLAKALNCEQGPTPTPCGTCSACVQIAEGRFLDLHELDAASNRGIDEIRSLRDTVAYAPAVGRCKVYVLDEAHQLTNDAFNALLKTLEEPPADLVFILATTDAHKIPATVASRCQRFEFRRASLEQLRERVAWVAAQEGAAIDSPALDLIAREANGGWRDALCVLEQVLAYAEGPITARDVHAVLGTVEAEALHALAERIHAADGAGVFRQLEVLIAEGKDPRQLLRDLTAHFRTLMLAAAGSAPAVDREVAGRLVEQARQFGHSRLIRALQVLAQTEREARWSEQPRLLLELAGMRLMYPEAPPVFEARAAETAPAPRAELQPAARTAPSAPSRSGSTGTPSPAPARPRTAAPAPAARPVVGREAPLPEPPPEPDSTGGGFGFDPLPPPPLTVGDARTGAGREDEDDDLAAAFPSPAAASGTLPPSAAAPTAGPPATAGDAAAELELLRRKWRLVREELKRDRKITVYTCISDTEPARLERGELVVRFPSRTLAELFAARGKSFSDPLAQAIQRVTGIACRVRGEHGAGGGAPPASGGGPSPRSQASPAVALPSAPAAVSTAVTAPAAPRAARAAPGAPPPAPGPTGSELVHNVLDVFEGRIVDDRD